MTWFEALPIHLQRMVVWEEIREACQVIRRRRKLMIENVMEDSKECGKNVTIVIYQRMKVRSLLVQLKDLEVL